MQVDALISAKTMQKYGKAHSSLFAWHTERPQESVHLERKETDISITL